MRDQGFTWRPIYNIITSHYEFGDLDSVTLQASCDPELRSSVEVVIDAEGEYGYAKLVYFLDTPEFIKLKEKLTGKMPEIMPM